MAVIAHLEAAEEFVADDPFVTGGDVGHWYLRAERGPPRAF